MGGGAAKRTPFGFYQELHSRIRSYRPRTYITVVLVWLVCEVCVVSFGMQSMHSSTLVWIGMRSIIMSLHKHGWFTTELPWYAKYAVFPPPHPTGMNWYAQYKNVVSQTWVIYDWIAMVCEVYGILRFPPRGPFVQCFTLVGMRIHSIKNFT